MEWKQNFRANLNKVQKLAMKKLNWTELNQNRKCFKQWEPHMAHPTLVSGGTTHE